MSVVSVSRRMSGRDLAILGHSCGRASTAPEGPHSHTAGGPIRIREMRLATTVLYRCSEMRISEKMQGDADLGRRMHSRMRMAGSTWRSSSLKVTYRA